MSHEKDALYMYFVTKTDSKSAQKKDALLQNFYWGLVRYPVLMLTVTMVLMGVVMVLAVAVGAIACILPIALLMGWI